MSGNIYWFNLMGEKSKHTFIVFDIKDFYPSISKYLPQKVLNFAKTKVSITQEDLPLSGTSSFYRQLNMDKKGIKLM